MDDDEEEKKILPAKRSKRDPRIEKIYKRRHGTNMHHVAYERLREQCRPS